MLFTVHTASRTNLVKEQVRIYLTRADQPIQSKIGCDTYVETHLNKASVVENFVRISD